MSNRNEGLRQRRRAGSEDGDDNGKRKSRKITLETFDLYTKVRDEEQVQTTSGATVTLLSVIVCLVLIASEVYRFMVPKQKEHMVVDPVIEGRLRINFDITFPGLQCSEANLDAMDVAGEQQNGIVHDMLKMRLSPNGTQIGDAFAHTIGEGEEAVEPLPPGYCGPCYGAQTQEGQCCNSCEEVRDAYASRGWNVMEIGVTSEQCVRERKAHQQSSQPGEGCRLTGHMMVNKVAGNFHIAMGETHSRGAGHIHQFNPAQIATFNTSHILHSLSFGEPFPGIRNPLDGTTNILTAGTGVFMYFAKVIPTIYVPQAAGRKNITTNQYSVTSQYRPAIVDGVRQNVLPGLFFVYDISPFQVTVTEHTSTLSELVTSLCAILGGVITAAGLLDSLLYSIQRKTGAKDMVSFFALLGEGHASTAAKIPGAAPPGAGVGPVVGSPGLGKPGMLGSPMGSPATGHGPAQGAYGSPQAGGSQPYAGGSPGPMAGSPYAGPGAVPASKLA